MSMLAVEQRTLEGLEYEPTLDELLVGVWTGLSSHRTVECPVCHGEMDPEYGAQALPIGGRCRSCGAALS
jgi:DnaJ-class molecular chaperone